MCKKSTGRLLHRDSLVQSRTGRQYCQGMKRYGALQCHDLATDWNVMCACSFAGRRSTLVNRRMEVIGASVVNGYGIMGTTFACNPPYLVSDTLQALDRLKLILPGQFSFAQMEPAFKGARLHTRLQFNTKYMCSKNNEFPPVCQHWQHLLRYEFLFFADTVNFNKARVSGSCICSRLCQFLCKGHSLR